MSDRNEEHPSHEDVEAFEQWLYGAEVNARIAQAAQPYRGMAEEARDAYTMLLDAGFADTDGLAAGACVQAITGCRQNRVAG